MMNFAVKMRIQIPFSFFLKSVMLCIDKAIAFVCAYACPSAFVLTNTFSAAFIMKSKSTSKFRHLLATLKSYAGYVGALALIVIVLAWQGDVFTPKMEPGAVDDARSVAGDEDTVQVEEVEMPIFRRLAGSVMPRERIELAAQVAGEVIESRVEVGDRVDAGETLFQVDPSLTEAQRAEAEAGLEMARADLRGAKALLSHIAPAAEADALPRTEAIKARQARDRAARAVERGQAALDAAETRAGFTALSSPVSGVVMARLRDAGDLVMPGQPVAMIYDPSRLEVVVAVPVSLLALCPPGAEIACELDALGQTVTGVVRTKEPRVDPATRTARIKLTIDPVPGVLPGMFARALVPDASEPALVVPASAVGRLRGLTYARVVNGEGRVDHRLVRPGRRVGDRLEILAGLDPGERVLRAYTWTPESGEAE